MCSLKSQRLDNRLLYFLGFKISLTSSYSNRALINYFNILMIKNSLKKRDNKVSYDDVGILHNLVINSIFRLYLKL